MIELVLVRHGETDWNAEHRFQGWTDLPLNREGRRQAAALAVRLRDVSYHQVISSDLRRAIETATLAGFSPRPDPAWRELDFGRVEGLVWDQLDEETRAALIRFDGFVAPGGESTADFTTRVVASCDSLPEGRHLIFTHGGVIRLLRRLCRAEGFPALSEVTVIDWETRRLQPFLPA